VNISMTILGNSSFSRPAIFSRANFPLIPRRLAEFEISSYGREPVLEDATSQYVSFVRAEPARSNHTDVFCHVTHDGETPPPFHNRIYASLTEYRP
jgi:hypothetical protein